VPFRKCVLLVPEAVFIDRQGKLVIAAQRVGFDPHERTDFAEGLAAVKVQGKYGYIDRKGAWVIPPQFDVATGFEPLDGIGARE
jgi:hypothetical protein